jgi:hypothetical protein
MQQMNLAMTTHELVGKLPRLAYALPLAVICKLIRVISTIWLSHTTSVWLAKVALF